jgi:hypothetical protein
LDASASAHLPPLMALMKLTPNPHNSITTTIPVITSGTISLPSKHHRKGGVIPALYFLYRQIFPFFQFFF